MPSFHRIAILLLCIVAGTVDHASSTDNFKGTTTKKSNSAESKAKHAAAQKRYMHKKFANFAPDEKIDFLDKRRAYDRNRKRNARSRQLSDPNSQATSAIDDVPRHGEPAPVIFYDFLRINEDGVKKQS